jgi:hypothetical protein
MRRPLDLVAVGVDCSPYPVEEPGLRVLVEHPMLRMGGEELEPALRLVGAVPGLHQPRHRGALEKPGRLDLGDDPVVGLEALGPVQ